MSPTRLLAGASLALVWASVFAQASAPRPDPLDPSAPATNLTVPRTFDEYLPYQEPKVAPWRDTNSAVSPTAGVQGGGMNHGGGAAMKHDMGKMSRPAASPAPAPEAARPASAEGTPPDGNTRHAPAGHAGHANHQM